MLLLSVLVALVVVVSTVDIFAPFVVVADDDGVAFKQPFQSMIIAARNKVQFKGQ